MEIYSYWFLLALILLGMEMASGTFYLLVVAIAMATGGVAALLGANREWQLVLCALMVIAGTMVLRLWKKSQRSTPADLNLDIGQPVQVLNWYDNGTARVLYRGAEWDAAPETADMPHEGIFYIKQMHGSGLILTHQKPQNS